MLGSQDFFLFDILIYFFRYETIETHARAFLTLIILAIGTVFWLSETLQIFRGRFKVGLPFRYLRK